MDYKLRKEFTRNPQTALLEILTDRGVKDLKNFIHPSKNCELNPHNLENIDLAADKLLYHLRNNSRICFIIDQDADGFTSSSILWLYIKNIFPDSDLSFTIHEHKQHGIDDKIDWLTDDEHFDLVLCPDAGSYNIDEHRRLFEINTDVICLDHHSIPKDDDNNDILPNPKWAIVVNNQLSPNYENKSLCGAGVVYKFCEILDEKLGIQQASNYLDLVALGEIADVMDRTDAETNYFMLYGLKNIRNKGFQTLLEAQSFSLKEKALYPYPNLTPIDIAFYIAPLINAITRVGTMSEKENMFYCFIEPNRPVKSTKRGAKDGDIEYAAQATARCGANAKSRQNRIKEKAADLIDFKIQKNQLDENNIIIVEVDTQDNIPQEMSGLIAMGVVNKYNKPCLIVRRNYQDLLQGSARSNNTFAALPSLKDYLEKSGYFEYAAGHDNAFGLGIYKNKMESFLKFINKDLPKDAFKNCYTVDYILDAREDNVDLLTSLAEHPEYFGNQIEEVKIIMTNISLANIMAMGANKDSMKISYNGIDYVRFKDIDFVEQVFANRTKNLTVFARINLNEFAGQISLQCFIDDYSFEADSHRYDFN